MPSLVSALIPIVFLVSLLSLSAYFFGDNASYGANQIALIFSGGVAALVGLRHGFRWPEIQETIGRTLSKVTSAILILLMVGSLIGSWILSGTVPTMIYYGLKLINPDIFYLTACIICAISSLSIGSSWSVAGTIGVGLMGISFGLGLDPAITAGAIISGAYFGDKMSPLSDTTNLAPAISGAELFEHIRNMMWTTGPAFAIALVLYLIIGFTVDSTGQGGNVGNTIEILEQNFSIGIHMLLPLVVVFTLAMKKYPAFPSLMIGTLVGLLWAFLFQTEVILKFTSDLSYSEILRQFIGMWQVLFDGFVINTENKEINDLLSRGGMSSMLNTIWLIICAITFGAIMEKTGCLSRIVLSALSTVKSTGSLILTTALSCIGVNILAAEQYIAIVLPGRMYQVEFEKRGLDPRNLSRTLEDSGTVTSVLIPWNTCGAFMAATLGIATLAYAPYCFFNILSPIITVIYGYLNIKIIPLEDSSEDQASPQTA